MTIPLSDFGSYTSPSAPLLPWLIARCANLAPVRTAVVHPCDGPSLKAAIEAAHAGLIEPILVGPEHKIRAAAVVAGADISRFRLVSVPYSHAAAAEAVAMAKRGEVGALMKGSLHSDELMHAIVAPQSGLSLGRRISHCYVFDIASYPRPTFDHRRSGEYYSLAERKARYLPERHRLGADPRHRKTQSRHFICRGNGERQTSLDHRCSRFVQNGRARPDQRRRAGWPACARQCRQPRGRGDQGLNSCVAGRADILLVPDLESGNMLAKQLTFVEGCEGAGVVVGALVPIILTSRADPQRSRSASCTIALLIAQSHRQSS